MKKVTKILMYVYRIKNEKSEFFVLNRKKGDNVVLTGHVKNSEALENAVKREMKEELGVKPLKITDLKFKTTVKIKSDNELSTEHTFLVEIPNDVNIKFLEHNEKHKWYSINDLPKILSYPNQIKPVKIIEKQLWKIISIKLKKIIPK